MGKLEVIEHLYPGKTWLTYTLSGKDLWGWVFKKYIGFVTYILEISGSKVYERFLMVDDTATYKGGTNIDYRYYLDFVKPWDKYTKFWLKTKLMGSQDLKTKDSTLTMKFEPYLKISFKYANSIQKSLLDLYWHAYYHKRVEKLKEQNKKLFENLVLEIKTQLGIKLVDEKVEKAWKEGF